MYPHPITARIQKSAGWLSFYNREGLIQKGPAKPVFLIYNARRKSGRRITGMIKGWEKNDV